MIDTIRQDLKYAARSLRRTPAFTAAAVITLALGIGANTTIFSLIEAVMLRRLPVAAPGELQFVAIGVPGQTGDRLTTMSNYPWFEQVRQRTDVFAGVTAFNIRDFKVASDAGAERVVGQYVSGNYHGLVGVPMALGRGSLRKTTALLAAAPSPSSATATGLVDSGDAATSSDASSSAAGDR